MTKNTPTYYVYKKTYTLLNTITNVAFLTSHYNLETLRRTVKYFRNVGVLTGHYNVKSLRSQWKQDVFVYWRTYGYGEELETIDYHLSHNPFDI